MASKRKKSRPTKIERDENLNLEEKKSDPDIDEDPLTRIQRFIEEESEDTPDACSERINWSPVKRILGSNEEVAVSNNRIINSEDISPNIFTNGHIPSNLKFHQLKKHEVESLERRSADSVFPVSRFETEATEKLIFNNSLLLLQQDLDLPLVNGHDGDDEEVTSFKPVAIPLTKKSPSKRAKVTDDETPRYACSTCKYVTNRSDHYKRHLMTHSADKPLKCSSCNYSTGRSDHYKRHLQRHGLSEKDIIETCSRNGLKLKSTSLSGLTDYSNGTKNIENMQELTQSNSSVKPFKGFGQKRFQCQTCNYSTDKMTHYTRHQNCHIKAEVHCDKCNRTFKSKSYFTQHKCGYLSDRRCPKCRTIFIDRNAVLLHIAREHINDDMIPVVNDNPKLNETDSIDTAVDLTCDAAHNNGKEVLEDEAKSSTPMAVAGTDKNQEPVDLTTTENQILPQGVQTSDDCNSVVILVKDIPTSSQGSESSEKDEQTLQNSGFVPKMPSARGNLGCTKCGEWFDKLNEYSSHACAS